MTAQATLGTIKQEQGTVFGAVLLLSGSCIGVGMLALPILTGLAGYLPTVAAFFICWAFMLTTSLLLLETLLWFPGTINLPGLTEKTLGKPAKILAWGSFIFLFYCLIIAYLNKGGELVQTVLHFYAASLPSWLGGFLLTLISMTVIWWGTSFVDHFNKVCMAGLFLAYATLLSFGVEEWNPRYLNHVDWSYSLYILPFIITSFGFHNMIPTVKEYLNESRSKLTLTIILASLVPFLIYILWVTNILSIVPLKGDISILNSYHNEEISTDPLSHLVSSPLIGIATQYFAFFAIITSLFGQSLSVIDFLADGMQVAKTKRWRMVLCSMLFVPSFFLSQFYPHLFFKMLECAGGIACMIIFGILPTLMVWRGREKMKSTHRPIVPGGKITLSLVIAFSIMILGYELCSNLGLLA